MSSVDVKHASSEKREPLRRAGRRHQFLLGILLGSSMLLPGCTSVSSEESPDEPITVGGVTCSAPTWNVGGIDPQKKRRQEHTFTLQNDTDKAIPITEVKPDCGCVVAEDGPRQIPPNGSVGIKVSFNATPAPGGFRHAVLVKLGSAEPTNFFLKIRGTILPNSGLVALPASLDFGRLAKSETKEQTIRVQRYDFSRVAVTKLTSNLQGCKLESRQAPDGMAILLSVTLGGAGMHPGAHSGIAFVETDHPTCPSVQVPIKAEVGTLADAFTSSLLIDAISPGGRQDVSLYRSSLPAAGRPKIVRLEYKGDPEIQIGPSPDGGELPRWRLSVSPEAKVGAVKRGTLRIGVSSARSDDIEVPVTVFVK